MKPEVESRSLEELDKETEQKVLEAAKETEPLVARHKSQMTRRRRIVILLIMIWMVTMN